MNLGSSVNFLKKQQTDDFLDVRQRELIETRRGGRFAEGALTPIDSVPPTPQHRLLPPLHPPQHLHHRTKQERPRE